MLGEVCFLEDSPPPLLALYFVNIFRQIRSHSHPSAAKQRGDGGESGKSVGRKKLTLRLTAIGEGVSPS